MLVVDDEASLRRLYGRTLESAGFDFVEAASGLEALSILDASGKAELSAIVSDITMPGMDGMEMVRTVRQRGFDTPVILVTGNPTVASATKAVEYGAMRYLVKPVAGAELVRAVNHAAQLHRIGMLNREAAAHLAAEEAALGDRRQLEHDLARGLETLWMAYQPIVNPVRQEIVAYEALVRTREPSLPHPGALFSVAERLGRVHEVGRAIRADVAGLLSQRRPEYDIFLNLHPLDLLDERLFAVDAPLAGFSHQVVLEVTERATLDRVHDVSGRLRALRGLGYRVAVDDLGAGDAGLNYFATLSPDVVKIDMALIRSIHLDAVRRRIVGSLCMLCKGLGMLVVAEGVELAEEAAVVTELGCDLLQGYFFARPDVAFPRVNWAPGSRDPT